MLRLASLAILTLGSSVMLADEPKDELKRVEGVWLIEAATLEGRDHLDDFAGMKMTITGDKYAIDFAENSDKGTIKLDATKNPKQIDLATGEKGPFKGRNLVGIYKFEGDTVVLCIESEKGNRPTKFDAPAKTKLMLLTFKRKK